MAARRRRQRQRKLALVGIVSSAAVVAIAAVVVGGVFAGTAPFKSCVIADVSRSTESARSSYVGAFESFAQEAGDEGSGQLCLILTGGDPLSQAHPAWVDVGPDSDPNSIEAPGEVQAKVRARAGEYARLLADPPVDSRGSELVESALIAGEQLGPGDHLAFLSDGLQHSAATGQIKRLALTDHQIQTTLDHLEANGLMADLRGVEVSFPLLNYRPGRSLRSSLAVRVERFWQDWAQRAGAEVVDAPIPSSGA